MKYVVYLAVDHSDPQRNRGLTVPTAGSL